MPRIGIRTIALAAIAITAQTAEGSQLTQSVTAFTAPDQPCITDVMYEALEAEWAAETGRSGPTLHAQTALFPTFHWPVPLTIDDDMVLVQYPDLDPSTPGRHDYEGLPHTGDGHRGIDFALLSFHAMDQGVPVFAAAGGLVTTVVYDKFDRNVLPPYPDQGNNVIIRHFDNTMGWYFHLRTNSTTVQVGDTVQQGDMLGLIGSSGHSFQSHLHFETGYWVNGNWIFRDPFTGPANPQPSLWDVQERYIGADPIRIYDIDISTDLAAGGSVSTITSPQHMQRLTAPAVMGAHEPSLLVWALVQGQQGDFFETRVFRPDNIMFASRVRTLSAKALWTWVNNVWAWDGNISPADYGTWRIDAVRNGQLQFQHFFDVGPATVYAPRFWPVAGRSLRPSGVELRDTLRIEAFGAPATYALLNPPAYVHLVDDSIVVIDAGAVLATKSVYFQATATGTTGLQDTMWYHLVDPNRPVSCPVSLTGDLNASGAISSADIITAVGFIFKGAPEPAPCQSVLDVNCDGIVTSADIIALVNFVFKGGTPPCDVCVLYPSMWSCP